MSRCGAGWHPAADCQSAFRSLRCIASSRLPTGRRMPSCPTSAHAVSTSTRKCPMTSGGQSLGCLFQCAPVLGVGQAPELPELLARKNELLIRFRVQRLGCRVPDDLVDADCCAPGRPQQEDRATAHALGIDSAIERNGQTRLDVERIQNGWIGRSMASP